MDNIFLKKVDKSDLYLLREYKDDYLKYGKKAWVEEESFENLISDWENDYNDNSKVHFYPFWLMKDEIVVGLVIIKTNTIADDYWYNYGLNISYEVCPSYRNNGYGTLSLSLALEECKKLGLNKIFISCFEKNIASKKIIEKNNGKFIETFVENERTNLKYVIEI